MQLYLKDSGEVVFVDGDRLNRNSLNRKIMTVSLETALATRESLWVQFGDGEDYDDINVNVLEPIRLSKEGEEYKTFFPDIVLEMPITWFITFAVRQYTTDGVTFSEQMTSDKVSFTVNDSYPLEDEGYVSNGTVENIWQQIDNSVKEADEYASAAAQSAHQSEISASEAAKSQELAKGSAEEAAQSAESAAKSANDIASLANRIVKFVPELSEVGEPDFIYAIVSNQDSNLFDLYAWVDGVKTHLGSANLVTDVDKLLYQTLTMDGWHNNQQALHIAELGKAQNVSVYPMDANAAEFVECGISVTVNGENLEFICETLPKTSIGIFIEVSFINELPTLSGYYTKAEIDKATGTSIELSVDSSTYIITLNLISKDGNILSTGSIDLPLESVVVGGSYNASEKSIVLTLNNGHTVIIPVADLIDGLASQSALNAEETARKASDAGINKRIDELESGGVPAGISKKVEHGLTLIANGEEVTYDGSSACRVDIHANISYNEKNEEMYIS